MKKNLLLTLIVALVATAAWAQPYPATPTNGPSTLNNYESCDISVAPAATLLLPYFEVDPSGTGENTLVTLTNVSDAAIVAHFTVWTDWSFPVLDFNVFLTGYDVQGLSLRDVLVSGNLPSTGNFGRSPIGRRSGGDFDGDGVRETNIFGPFSNPFSCGSNQGGTGAIPGYLLEQVQSALTGGPYAAGGVPCEQVGGISDSYIGYITIDTASFCTQSLPSDPAYHTTEILMDNQLIGDYIRLNDAEGVAGGNPLVHIKAVPGGDPGTYVTVTGNVMSGTFYQRYQFNNAPNDRADRRQPLPALFAGRYIEAGTAFDTDFVIWREGYTDEDETNDCNGDVEAIYPFNNSRLSFTETVRFDERENPTVRGGCTVSPCPPSDLTSETQLENVNGGFFPADPSSDTGGWIYMNLSHTLGDALGTRVSYARPSQNWVQVRMTGAGLYGVDFDAAYLGNGCTPGTGLTATTGVVFDVLGFAYGSGNKIGPKYDVANQFFAGN